MKIDCAGQLSFHGDRFVTLFGKFPVRFKARPGVFLRDNE
jgi:hypothetical protein